MCEFSLNCQTDFKYGSLQPPFIFKKDIKSIFYYLLLDKKMPKTKRNHNKYFIRYTYKKWVVHAYRLFIYEKQIDLIFMLVRMAHRLSFNCSLSGMP